MGETVIGNGAIQTHSHYRIKDYHILYSYLKTYNGTAGCLFFNLTLNNLISIALSNKISIKEYFSGKVGTMRRC